MKLEELARYISLQLPQAWINCYEPAMAAYRPNWLDEYDFDAILDYYEFDNGEYYRPRFYQELDLLRQDEKLNRICWLMHYIMFYGEPADFSNVWSWKGEPVAFADHGSNVTCVVAFLTGQPSHVKNMAERGYDAEQIEIHRAGVRRVWEGQHTTFGLEGVTFGHMLWAAYFIRCFLIRLGRLQYEFGLKHFSQHDHLFEEIPCYIYIHIPPADNGLQEDEVAQSVRMATQKLAQYFPQTAGKKLVFYTNTWLLSPELRQILKPGSNIIKFQDRFQILELAENPAPFLSFGFNVIKTPDLDYNTLPEDTHLRRELKARLIRGEPLHTATGYFTV